MNNAKKIMMGVAALAAMALGGSALANASSQSGSTGSTNATQSTAVDDHNTKADVEINDDGAAKDDGDGEKHDKADAQLTGSAAEKAKSAALAKVSGKVSSVESDDDGGAYEVKVVKSDGTTVELKLDKAFKVTANAADDDQGGQGEH